MKAATLCSGIGAPETAMPEWDWRWCAEIEPFPSAVLAARFGAGAPERLPDPDEEGLDDDTRDQRRLAMAAVAAHEWPIQPRMPNLGDLSAPDFVERAVAAGLVDVLVAGTPCQSFSVAGMRNGLDDARGNLTLRALQILEGLDHAARSAGHARPIFVWENVPGVLSDATNAFGCLLAGLVGSDTALVPPRECGGRWTDAGMVAGPRRRAAWRTLDAQHFGLAQRRRRVFLVASPLEGADPAAILLERKGVLGDSPARRGAGQGAAAGAGRRAAVSSGKGWWSEGSVAVTLRAQDSVTKADTLLVDDEVRRPSHWDGDFPHPTLTQSASGSGGVGASNQELFSQRGAYLVPDVAGTLQDSATQQGAEAHLPAPMAFGGGNTSGPVDVAATLLAHPGHKGDFESETFIAEPLVYQDSEFGVQGYPTAGTLRAGRIPEHQMVLEGAVCVTGQVTHALRAEGADASEDGTGRGTPIISFAIQERAICENPNAGPDGAGFKAEIAYTLEARAVPQAVAFAQNQRDEVQTMDVVGALSAQAGAKQQTYVSIPASRQSVGHVRRLMPVECERLQGFADEATNIAFRGKPAADGARYKALGNSMAVPVLRWILWRLERAASRAKTPFDVA